MIILEGLFFAIALYLSAGASFYMYSVLIHWSITDFWDFKIKDGYIAGICRYPKWLLSWVEWIVKKFKRGV